MFFQLEILLYRVCICMWSPWGKSELLCKELRSKRASSEVDTQNNTKELFKLFFSWRSSTRTRMDVRKKKRSLTFWNFELFTYYVKFWSGRLNRLKKSCIFEIFICIRKYNNTYRVLITLSLLSCYLKLINQHVVQVMYKIHYRSMPCWFHWRFWTFFLVEK